MKRIIGLIIFLNTNDALAGVDGIASRQISNQVSRSTSNSISRNIDYRQIYSERAKQDTSTHSNNYGQYGKDLDSNQSLPPPPSYAPIYPYPNVGGFNQ